MKTLEQRWAGRRMKTLEQRWAEAALDAALTTGPLLDHPDPDVQKYAQQVVVFMRLTTELHGQKGEPITKRFSDTIQDPPHQSRTQDPQRKIPDVAPAARDDEEDDEGTKECFFCGAEKNLCIKWQDAGYVWVCKDGCKK